MEGGANYICSHEFEATTPEHAADIFVYEETENLVCAQVNSIPALHFAIGSLVIAVVCMFIGFILGVNRR